MPHDFSRFGPVVVMSGTAVTPGTYYTQPVYHGKFHRLAYQVPYADTPTFNLSLHSTLDPQAGREAKSWTSESHQQAGTADWFTEDVSTLSGTTGVASGTMLYHLENVNSLWSRFRIDVTASGTVGPIRVSGKL